MDGLPADASGSCPPRRHRPWSVGPSLFNVLLAPTITLPFTITTLVNAAVSGRRIVRFLKLPAADPPGQAMRDCA